MQYQSQPISRPRFSTINFETSYGKKVTAEIETKDDEVTVLSLSVYAGRYFSFYSKKECSRHEWLLYNAIKNYLYE